MGARWPRPPAEAIDVGVSVAPTSQRGRPTAEQVLSPTCRETRLVKLSSSWSLLILQTCIIFIARLSPQAPSPPSSSSPASRSSERSWRASLSSSGSSSCCWGARFSSAPSLHRGSEASAQNHMQIKAAGEHAEVGKGGREAAAGGRETGIIRQEQLVNKEVQGNKC